VLPLRAHGVTVGALAVSNRPGTAFTADDLRLLSTVATHAAIVLSNARFFDLVRAGRDQWETTFNALAEGIAVVDDTGCIRRTNRALADLVQVSVPALTGQNLAEALFGDATTLAEFLDAAQRGEPAPLSRRSTPLQRLLRITAAPMRGTGQERWVVALVNDITEQRAMEAQLIQSEKMAAVGQLVSGVAHELNNPLTSIAGLAEFLLEQGAPTERDRDHMKVIREQADRAGRIVRNLLTFARKGPADLGAILLNDIVQRTVALVSYEIRLREIQLETDYQASLVPIRGDRYQIQQVVVNLVTNAVHAVEANPPERPRRIVIRTEADEEHVTLRVADTGRGVPADVAAQIFTPFFTTKDPGEGTGLGLSISYRIVEGHGGTLGVEAGEDGGAVFVMRLPVGAPSPDDAQATDALPSEPATISEPVPPRARRRTVLLVDDDPAVRRMIGVLLSNEEQSVEAARDAAHAISLLEQRQFDVIIADPRAAVSAGERFAEHLLRRWPDARHRTILVTADVRPETEAWLKELGCRYFVKPFRIGELKTATAEVLGGATTN